MLIVGEVPIQGDPKIRGIVFPLKDSSIDENSGGGGLKEKKMAWHFVSFILTRHRRHQLRIVSI